jgi:hypothetical protein
MAIEVAKIGCHCELRVLWAVLLHKKASAERSKKTVLQGFLWR